MTISMKLGNIPIVSMDKWDFDLSNGLIDKIFEIRSRNNKNWMDLLRLVFKHAPEEAAKIMQSISDCDAEINKLSKQLGELK